MLLTGDYGNYFAILVFNSMQSLKDGDQEIVKNVRNFEKMAELRWVVTTVYNEIYLEIFLDFLYCFMAIFSSYREIYSASIFLTTK